MFGVSELVCMKRRRTGMCVPLNLPIWRSISRTVLIGIGSCLRHSESPVKISIQNMSDKYSLDAILWITSECIRTQRQFKQRYYFKSICVQNLPVRFLFVFLWIWAATHYIGTIWIRKNAFHSSRTTIRHGNTQYIRFWEKGGLSYPQIYRQK